MENGQNLKEKIFEKNKKKTHHRSGIQPLDKTC
jgi:hypothetical protein